MEQLLCSRQLPAKLAQMNNFIAHRLRQWLWRKHGNPVGKYERWPECLILRLDPERPRLAGKDRYEFEKFFAAKDSADALGVGGGGGIVFRFIDTRQRIPV